MFPIIYQAKFPSKRRKSISWKQRGINNPLGPSGHYAVEACEINKKKRISAKDAARSATITKGMYRAWCERKIFEFDERIVRRVDRYWQYALRTLRRYVDTGLKIHTLTLRLISGLERAYDASRLIKYAVELGVVEIVIELHNEDMTFYIPEVVFLSEQVTKLSVIGGTLFVGVEIQVSRLKLKSLNVHPKHIMGYEGDFVSNYVLRLPFLKELVCDGYLLVFNSRMLDNYFHMLQSLTIDNLVGKESLFFSEVMCRFPQLKTLIIRKVSKCGALRISSETLEYISIVERYRSLVADFNVPNLRRFHFKGVPTSLFTMGTHNMELESHIHVLCFCSNGSWFSSLHSLLQTFNASKVFLYIHAVLDHSNFKCFYSGDGPVMAVELLDVRARSPTPGLVESLLKICRPKLFKHEVIAGLR